MLNPIITKRQYLLTYSLIWLSVCFVHFLIFYLSKGFNIYFSIADAIVFNSIFYLIGLGIWSLLVFTGKEKNKFILILSTHLISSVVIVVIWIYVSETIRNEIVPNNDNLSVNYVSRLNRFLIGILYYTVITLSYYILIFYTNLKEKIINESKLETIIKESELKVLKSQINPHFLFNSLNSISSLTISNPQLAQEMIINLSNFLRYSISQKDNHITTLNKELENCKKYLEIEKIRFGDKIDLLMKIENDSLQAALPIMILQPLYENAIKYGVYESSSKVIIETISKIRDNTLIITIRNNYDKTSIPLKGEGIGLKNIQERLRLNYNSENLLRISKNDNIFEVTIYIPQNQTFNL
jgi:sensor histidine kinase YesM